MVILRRTLLNAAFDGRVTFMVAGAVLGVGIYGFAVTFKPYDSGRIPQSFRVPVVSLVASGGPVIEPPSSVFPEAVAPETAVAPQAPGDVLVAVPVARAVAPAPAAPPPVSAAGGGEPEPLPPVPEEPAPRGIGPIEIAPENVLVYIYPPRRGDKDDDDETQAPKGDDGAHEGDSRDSDARGDKETSSFARMGD
ncbi:MAG: hypothetical protein ACRDHF_08720 [Tepidiformaceae bacterium]